MVADRYPTRKSRESRRGSTQTFRRDDTAFLAPPLPPEVVAPAPAAVPAAAGAWVATGAALGAVVVGFGLGYYAVTDWRKPPKLKRYRDFSANPNAYQPLKDYDDFIVSFTVPASGWWSRDYAYRHCTLPATRWHNPVHDGWDARLAIDGVMSGVAVCPPSTFVDFASPVPQYLSPFEAWSQSTPNVPDISGFAKVGTKWRLVETYAYRGYGAPATWVQLSPGPHAFALSEPLRDPEFDFSDAGYGHPAVDHGISPRRRYDLSTDPGLDFDPAPVEIPVDFPISIVPYPGVGPGLDPGPGTGPGVEPVPQPQPPPAFPDQYLGLETSYYASPSTEAQLHRPQRPPRGGDRNPGRRNKERKVNVRNSAFGPAWVFLNAVTEGQEFIDDLWKSLPRWAKRKRFDRAGKRRRANTGEKLADMYRNWQHLDVPEMVANVVNDQLSDIFYSLPGRGQKWAARKQFDAYGFGQFTNRNVVSRYRPNSKGERDVKPLVPRINYRDDRRQYELVDYLAWDPLWEAPHSPK